jgi:hypothetical protein
MVARVSLAWARIRLAQRGKSAAKKAREGHLGSAGGAGGAPLSYPEGMAHDSQPRRFGTHPPDANLAVIAAYWAVLGVGFVAFLWGFAKLWNSFFGSGTGGGRGALVCLISSFVIFMAAGLMHRYERSLS